MMDLSEHQADLAEMRREQDGLDAEEQARLVPEAEARALLLMQTAIHERHRRAVLAAEAGLCSRMSAVARRRAALSERIARWNAAGETLIAAARHYARLRGSRA